MAYTPIIYGNLGISLFSKKINYTSDTIKVALVSSSYTPNQDTHDFWDDVSANEITGTGYTTGGATLSNKTITYNSSTNKTTLDADNVTWSSCTFTCRYVVIYCDSGTASTSALIAYIDLGADIATANGTFTLTFDGSGIMSVTVV